jgi:hypothetical protein
MNHYTRDQLAAMPRHKLQAVHITTARKLGLPPARHAAPRGKRHAVAATWALLEYLRTAKHAPADQYVPRCAQPRVVQRVTRKALRRIHIVKQHPGSGLRAKRWANYREGMTLLEVAQAPNADVRDVHYYVRHGLMKLLPPTREPKKSRTR